MNIFNINWDKLVLLLLPTFLRKPVMAAFLRSALFPVQKMYGSFKNNRKNALFLLTYDTSRRNLELALRMQFDEEYQFDEDRIYIENAVCEEGLSLSFYLDDYIRPGGYRRETKTAYLGGEGENKLFLNFYLDSEALTDDFTIYVPEAIYRTQEKYVKKITDFASLFILPGFKFSVVGH